MTTFLARERVRQAALKSDPALFSPAAGADGEYKGKPRPFCLPPACAAENLFVDIRRPALRYFASHSIGWHDGHADRPSNHLCSSQVCCANMLFPFGSEPGALAELLGPVFPSLRRMLPVEDGLYVAFEWIGPRNYLGEHVRSDAARTRGANVTSSDAIVLFERSDSTRQAVLIEWKYTEGYSPVPLRFSARGTDRAAIYAHLLNHPDCPIDMAAVPRVDALFYEPFYQLMRQQLLAHEMERAGELGADIVSVLQITPSANAEIDAVTSPMLRSLGAGVKEVWRSLLCRPDRFASVSTETLFGAWPAAHHPQLAAWHSYVLKRYAWLELVVRVPSSARDRNSLHAAYQRNGG